MTRKDYKLIATAIRNSACVTSNRSADFDEGARTQLDVTMIAISLALESKNKNFNHQMFMEACHDI